jgi:hypothetical protein
MSLRTTLSEAALEYVRSCAEPPSMDEIVEHLFEMFRDELAEEGEKAQRDYVRGAAKSGLGDKPRDDRQLTLSGFDVPATLTVPLAEGRTVYVAFENATRDQAHAHIAIKDANIAHAIEERRKYVEFLDLLDTVWLVDPELTGGECLMRVKEQI